jgi:ubiquinone/menaquinone biosynthesis C-methylase UbiE
MSAHGKSHGHSHGAHDWSDKEYVAEWITKDSGREAERRQLLDNMLVAAPFAKDAAITVLDVGGGNGRVTDAVLRAFPNAKVTLQDFSQPMLDQAKQRFAAKAGQMSYVLADLTEAGWEKKIGGPFDLAVSGIAIHNLRELPAIAAVYKAVRSVMKPGGCFLDCDHFDRAGGLDANKDAFRKSGFANVELVGPEGHPSTLKASV